MKTLNSFAPNRILAGLLTNGSRLILTAICLSVVATSISAQNFTQPRIAPERHFTIAPSVHTPMVLKTEQDAVCSLHQAGDFDAAHSMKLYANGDGYV